MVSKVRKLLTARQSLTVGWTQRPWAWTVHFNGSLTARKVTLENDSPRHLEGTRSSGDIRAAVCFLKRKRKRREKKASLCGHMANLSVYRRMSHVTEFHKNSLSRFMILQKTPGKTA